MIGGSGEKRMLRIVAEYADAWNTWGLPDLIAHKSRVLDEHCAAIGRKPDAIARTAQALTKVGGELPDDLPMPAIGGPVAKLTDEIGHYAAIGLDELIVPDRLLGTGAERLRAMDVIRGIVPV
jgi:alkanesulfonate monooxygenase SsuD/methylene tetrahydromethanopterin reductase-like flavin-dependent oxidoreductase (luciferase family)